MKPLQTKTAGILSAVGAYVFWGILPVYWKLVGEVPAGEILAHRIFWSFIFMAGIVVVMKKNRILLSECRQIMASTQKLLSVTAGALLISLNWFIYIWAVNANRVIDTSLGYYINPLFNVLIRGRCFARKADFLANDIGAAGCRRCIQYGTAFWRCSLGIHCAGCFVRILWLMQEKGRSYRNYQHYCGNTAGCPVCFGIPHLSSACRRWVFTIFFGNLRFVSRSRCCYGNTPVAIFQ